MNDNRFQNSHSSHIKRNARRHTRPGAHQTARHRIARQDKFAVNRFAAWNIYRFAETSGCEILIIAIFRAAHSKHAHAYESKRRPVCALLGDTAAQSVCTRTANLARDRRQTVEAAEWWSGDGCFYSRWVWFFFLFCKRATLALSGIDTSISRCDGWIFRGGEQRE